MLKAGQKFAHFEILNKLGEGGMGAVFLARDTKLDRRVALKILTGELFDDQSRLERFRREARTAAQISNAYVMSTFDIGSAAAVEGGPELNYIVLEYVEGRPLNEYVKEERPALTALVRLGEKIASGLAAAHKLNIVHRDIKPENILIEDSGDPKILDFGLAKPLEPLFREEKSDSTRTVSEELTKVGKIMGTVSYMSPEQVRGDNVDTRSDIFAFGILLYRMVTGDLPFAGPTQVETMAKILESSFDPPRAKNEAIPAELERIITKCLQKDPEDRYQSSRDLVVDLRNVRRQFDSGVTDSITQTGATAQMSARRPRGLRVAGMVVAIAAALFVVFKFAGNDDSGPVSSGLQAKSNALAIVGFENKTGDAGLDWLQTGLPEILLTDLSQNQEVPIISQQRILDCFDVAKKLVHTHEECIEVARSLGATRLLSGSFYKLGEKIRIDARLEDAGTGNIVLAEKVIGDDPFTLVDSLTAKIASALNLGAIDKSEAIATSPEAFKAYHLGMELFWAGDNDSAIARFAEAIALDSSFALPYLRIAMAHQFSGRNAMALPYFQMAQERKDRLPLRERRLLDAYYDTWALSEFDRAFTKIETLVHDYPDDAEIRTIYALYLNSFRSDTVATYAQYDTILAAYPTYAFAISTYSQVLRQNGNLERSAYFVQRLTETLPNSVDPQNELILLRQRQGNWAEAYRLAEDLHRKHPKDQRPLNRLISLAFHMQEIDKARTYVEALKSLSPEEPYDLVAYYQYLANADVWEGKFRESMRKRFSELDEALKTGDSTQIFAAYNGIGDYYRRFEFVDSMDVYESKGYEYATGFTRLNYLMRQARYFPEREATVRPQFETMLNDTRARVPREFWGTIDGLQSMFDALMVRDTLAMIAATRKIISESGEQGGENSFQLGELLVATGEFEEGKELLSLFLEGNFRTSNAWRFLTATYWVGRADEGLGLTDEAIRNYELFLKYWANADFQIELIRDAKTRLAALTS